MGKKKRGKDNDKDNDKDKKIKLVKTPEQRLQEVTLIRQQISDLGLGDGNPDVEKFYQELEQFTKTGYSWTGKIPLHGHHRVISATLTTNPNITSSVTLLYDPQK